MTIGSSRHPGQTFGRSTFEPEPSDKDLLPKPIIRRPETVVDIKAENIEGLPWVRERGQEWTAPDFRERILLFVRDYLKGRRADGLVGWRIVEKSAVRRAMVQRNKTLIFFLRRERPDGCGGRETVEAEVAAAFPPELREGSPLDAHLVNIAAAFDAAI